MRGRAARAPRDLVGAIRTDGSGEHARSARDDAFEFFDAVEVETHGDAEAVAQRRRQQAEARRGADQRELGEVDAHRARRRTLADDEVELIVLQRRIEDFLDRRAQAMDLVDEEDVAVFEVGEQRREIAGLGDDRTGGGAEADAQLLRHDLGKRRFAETGWTGKQHVVEGFAAIARRLDENAEVGARLLLADELGERLRTQRSFGDVGVALDAGDEPVGHGLFLSCFAAGVKANDHVRRGKADWREVPPGQPRATSIGRRRCPPCRQRPSRRQTHRQRAED